MAIRFVDVAPEGEKSKKATPKPAPDVDREAPAASVEPELPHAKPDPKPRGRKKPLR